MGGQAADEVIVLGGSSDDEPAPAKRPRHTAPPAASRPLAPEPPAAASAAAAAAAASSHGNSLLAELAAARHAKRGLPPVHVPPAPSVNRLRLLSYNVWFTDKQEDGYAGRMAALGAIVAREQPDVLLLQEVVEPIEALLSAQPWAAGYVASPSPDGCPYYTLMFVRRALVAHPAQFRRLPFSGSRMGRDVLFTGLALGNGCRMLVATSHLESWTGPQSTGAAERVSQLKEAVAKLPTIGGLVGASIVYGGDLNWSEDSDGPMERCLPTGWVDAWPALYPGQPGFTYDAKLNPMLSGGLRKRLDRFVCTLAEGWRLDSAELLGTEAIPGQTFLLRLRSGTTKAIPVAPSDHFGLMLTLRHGGE